MVELYVKKECWQEIKNLEEAARESQRNRDISARVRAMDRLLGKHSWFAVLGIYVA